MTILEIKNISKNYEKNRILENISIAIDSGEILSIIGPSGCGKSTILRLIAGLETPNSGEIFLEKKCIFSKNHFVEPEKRSIGMVFQDYALFPHLSVFQNITFGISNLSQKEQKNIVKNLLKTVGLENLDNRYPHELSGGQQQRVALARALAKKPKILLLDEPFSNIDASLREKMRIDIKNIIKKNNITAIFVTHDQKEALSISDKIAIIDRGFVAQLGTPMDLYWRPNSKFCASFLGNTNFFNAKIHNNSVDIGITILDLDRILLDKVENQEFILSIRPEMINIKKTTSTKNSAIVKEILFLGEYQELILEKNSILFKVYADSWLSFYKNELVEFTIDMTKTSFLTH